MKEKIEVQMTVEALFDFMLYHTYSKFTGFLTNVLGMAIVIMGIILSISGKASVGNLCFYLLAGAAFLIYVPLQLRFRAKAQVRHNDEFCEVKTYFFSEEGIEVEGMQQPKTSWAEITKVVAAPKTIGFYYGENEAYIIPKADFKERFLPVMKLVSRYVKHDKIRFR